MIRTYYELTKPGIIYGNVLNASAGFFLAAQNMANPFLLVATLMGLSLVVGSACVLNNIFDADIDAKMARTKKRALAAGSISKKDARNFALVLLFLGSAVLALFTTMFALAAALLGFLIYIGPYTYAKRRTPFAAHIGSIAGAMPPVVGYAAFTPMFNTELYALFLIYALWQLPHFFAIGIYRSEEYKAAGIPVLPLTHGMLTTKFQILIYVVAFAIAVLSLPYMALTGPVYIFIMSLASVVWIVLALNGFSAQDDTKWAQTMFRYSLVVVLLLFVALILQR